MLLHAFTDGLVAFSCLWFYVQFASSTRSGHKLVALSMLLMALAATAGTTKFALGLIEQLQPWHSLLSNLSATSGMGLLFAGLLLTFYNKGVNTRQYNLLLLAALALFGIGQFLINQAWYPLVIGALANVTGLVVGFIWYKRGLSQGIWLSAASVLIIINGLVIGSSEKLLLGVVSAFDLFHVILAVWAAMIYQALDDSKQYQLA